MKDACSLEISGKGLNPDLVSSILETDPDRTRQEGDTVSGRSGAKALQGLWAIDSADRVDSPTVDDHLTYVVSYIDRHRTMLERIKIEFNCAIRLRIFWTFSEVISLSIHATVLNGIVDSIELSIV